MRKRILLLIVPALIPFAACGDDGEEDSGDATTIATTTARTVAATPTSDAALGDVCAENPDPATDESTQVDEPAAGDEVSNPVIVRGRIMAFEAVYKITIFDEDGNVLADQRSMTAEGTTLAPFEEDVSFTVTEETPACLWVYGQSGRDGGPDNVVQVPVLLVP